jgi:GntR family transcriptional regulator
VATLTLTERIYAELRKRITSGELRPGERIPTEAALIEQFGVSRNTINRVTQDLRNAGLIRFVPGRHGGYLVRDRTRVIVPAWRAEFPDGLYSEADSFFGSIREQGLTPGQVFSCRTERLDAEDAALLAVAPGSQAAVRRCQRSIDGHPSSIQDTFYPDWLAVDVPELLSAVDIPSGTTRLLAERGYRQEAFVDSWVSRMPSPEETGFLQLEPGTGILEWVRTGYLADGRAVRVSRTAFEGDRNTAQYLLGNMAALRLAGVLK